LPSVQVRRRGRAARLGSAKAPTPVRIRTMPQKPSKQFEGFFYAENFLKSQFFKIPNSNLLKYCKGCKVAKLKGSVFSFDEGEKTINTLHLTGFKNLLGIKLYYLFVFNKLC
jgi:hypothetical protein